ncbi:PREDICTED: probable E3 ubiquitin-protein ligase ARI16 [Tarenaya hassleriana]|uniref:probable E3 ubiquitin-protein ligase ARI16 n=1 Tax=Tarenaya hassleriana TaxID=28532 RepID=UPI00053C29A5|nr:PREDICTED: probable E3 ubiquitin-protein ligase ARI16 [Tarenaya hassleriana]
MDSQEHRSYSVITEREICAKMDKQIDEISEIFSVSKSAATVILLSQRWNVFRVSDRLGDDQDMFLEEFGLKSDGSKQDEPTDSTSCGICLESSTADGHQTHVLVSTPLCSHNFCTKCWMEYLENCLDKSSPSDKISCPHLGCKAAVGPNTIQRLPETAKEIYKRYVLSSYMESSKKSIKWCPSPDCEYAIELIQEEEEKDSSDDEEEKEDGFFNVMCRCSYTFCWKCEHESHRPVTCNNASDWGRSVSAGITDHESLNVAWIAENTKPCPSCSRPIQFVPEGGYNFLNCASPCRFHFCWKCMRSVEDHLGEECVETSVPADVSEKWAFDQDRSLYVDLFEEGDRAMQQAIRDLRRIEKSVMPELGKEFGTSEQNLGFVREAWMLIVQCRQILKWSYVYDYFLSEYENAKKQYLRHLREEAIDTLFGFSEKLKDETEEALAAGGTLKEIGFFRSKLSSLTRPTRIHFLHLVKTLEEGIPEVKVGSYDDVAGNHWFCDRCTYQNSWLDKGCKMCLLDTALVASLSLSD